MNRDLDTGDTAGRDGDTTLVGENALGGAMANRWQATMDIARQEESGPGVGVVDRRAANALVSQAPAARMADGQITVGVEVFDAGSEWTVSHDR